MPARSHERVHPCQEPLMCSQRPCYLQTTDTRNAVVAAVAVAGWHGHYHHQDPAQLQEDSEVLEEDSYQELLLLLTLEDADSCSLLSMFLFLYWHHT